MWFRIHKKPYSDEFIYELLIAYNLPHSLFTTATAAAIQSISIQHIINSSIKTNDSPSNTTNLVENMWINFCALPNKIIMDKSHNHCSSALLAKVAAVIVYYLYVCSSFCSSDFANLHHTMTMCESMWIRWVGMFRWYKKGLLEGIIQIKMRRIESTTTTTIPQLDCVSWDLYINLSKELLIVSGKMYDIFGRRR